jgi:hypothetical protein
MAATRSRTSFNDLDLSDILQHPIRINLLPQILNFLLVLLTLLYAKPICGLSPVEECNHSQTFFGSITASFSNSELSSQPAVEVGKVDSDDAADRPVPDVPHVPSTLAVSHVVQRIKARNAIQALPDWFIVSPGFLPASP